MTYETRHKKAGILCWLSSLLFLSGVLIIASVIYMDSKTDNKMLPDELIVQKTASAAVMWLCALISIGVGVLGILLVKCHSKRWFIMLYGSGLGIIGLSVLITGIVFAF